MEQDQITGYKYCKTTIISKYTSENALAKLTYKELQEIAKSLSLPTKLKHKVLLSLIIAHKLGRKDIVNIIVRTYWARNTHIWEKRKKSSCRSQNPNSPQTLSDDKNASGLNSMDILDAHDLGNLSYESQRQSLTQASGNETSFDCAQFSGNLSSLTNMDILAAVDLDDISENQSTVHEQLVRQLSSTYDLLKLPSTSFDSNELKDNVKSSNDFDLNSFPVFSDDEIQSIFDVKDVCNDYTTRPTDVKDREVLLAKMTTSFDSGNGSSFSLNDFMQETEGDANCSTIFGDLLSEKYMLSDFSFPVSIKTENNEEDLGVSIVQLLEEHFNK